MNISEDKKAVLRAFGDKLMSRNVWNVNINFKNQ
jgi:hypothetical protein